ncbi:MAG: hypothetical protein ACFFCM_05675 [Promethearchaeota archaeon]
MEYFQQRHTDQQSEELKRISPILYQLLLDNQNKLKDPYPDKSVILILKDINLIREKINLNEWTKVLEKLNSLEEDFKNEKNKFGIKIINAYMNLLDGIELFGGSDPKNAIKKLNKSFKLFPEQGFELEQNKILTYIGILYDQLDNSKQALKAFFDAWKYISKSNDEEFELLGDKKLRSFLFNKIFQLRDNIKDVDITISLIKEKLSKCTDNIEYEEIEKEYINKLIDVKRYFIALEFLSSKGITIDKYLKEFEILYNVFRKKQSVELTIAVSKLLKMDWVLEETKQKLNNWTEELYQKIFELFFKKIEKFIEQDGFNYVVMLILSRKDVAEDFIRNIFNLTKNLYKNPEQKSIMRFILSTNEILQDIGSTREAEITHSWIRITLALRKISDIDSKTYFDLILNTIRTTIDNLSPLFLMERYFKEIFLSHGGVGISSCNNFSEFIHKLKITMYNTPNYPSRDYILQKIEEYMQVLVKAYKTIMLYRMKSQSIDRIQMSGKNAFPMVAASIMKDVSGVNPSPISRVLQKFIDHWRNLPDLKKVTYMYNSTLTTKLKPVFWFGVMDLIISHHYAINYQRLPENEMVHREDLIEIIITYLNFFYEVKKVPGVKISNKENRQQVIKFLKKVNELNQFSDEELTELIYSSKWKSNSKKLLKNLIEEKNYCIYCSYNMPPKSKKCPNCGKKVGEISPEESSIDFEKMGDFFGTTSENE